MKFYPTCIVVLMTNLLTSACNTVPENSDLRKIVSEPTGAYVDIVGTGSSCTTPCTIRLDRNLKVIVSKEGYVSQMFHVEPGSGVIRVQLNLAAASEKVDEVILPEL